jgi:hypothetical protein
VSEFTEPFEFSTLENMLPDAPNADLLQALDLVLLELERRLLRYVEGTEVLGVADEGLVLAVRTGARLAQARSAAAHAQGHLQIVGVGDWNPRSTEPGWRNDPRVVGDQ